MRLRPYILIGVVFLGSLFLYIRASQQFAWDYAINWTAANGVRLGTSLYNGPALRLLGEQRIGPSMSVLFDQPFHSYIGLPTTALFLLPFTLWSFPTSLAIYRLAALLAFITSIFISGYAVTERHRFVAWVTGVFCLLVWQSVVFSLELGQVDAWVLVSLAICVYGVHQGHWRTAGVGLGVATLLKVSPGLLIFYCLLKRQWTVVGSALLTILAGLILSCIPQQGADLQVFIVRILPGLGGGSIHLQNQSLGAWLARLSAENPEFLIFTLPIGLWRYTGVSLTIGFVLLLWWMRRTMSLAPRELGIVILLALLAGPITWDHYTSWAIVSAMVLMPALNGAKRTLFVVLLGILALPILYIPQEVIQGAPWLRIFTGTQTVALLGSVVLSLYNEYEMRLAPVET